MFATELEWKLEILCSVERTTDLEVRVNAAIVFISTLNQSNHHGGVTAHADVGHVTLIGTLSSALPARSCYMGNPPSFYPLP